VLDGLGRAFRRLFGPDRHVGIKSASWRSKRVVPIVDVRVDRPPAQALEVFDIANCIDVAKDFLIGTSEANLSLEEKEPLRLADAAHSQDGLICRGFFHVLHPFQ
jgi:hypothetical protein